MSAERIGIIGGSGDLGQRLSVQACETYENVTSYDVQPKPVSVGAIGIDARIRHTARSLQPAQAESLEEVIATSSILHWTAPIDAAHTIGDIPADTLLVFHDSVMYASMETVRQRQIAQKAGHTAVVHCLMNNKRRVVVAEESEAREQTLHHLKQLGLEPTILPYKEHDRIMAESQAPMALLHELLADKLSSYEREGLLTPSGHDLMEALNARAAQWTDTTLRTILQNPAVPELIEKMREKTNGRIKN